MNTYDASYDWHAVILDRPLVDIPEYVRGCIDLSGGTDFYIVMGRNQQGVEVDVAHVGNGPNSHKTVRVIAQAPKMLELLQDICEEFGWTEEIVASGGILANTDLAKRAVTLIREATR